MTVKEVKQAGASTAKLATLVGKAKQFIIDKTTWRPHIMDGSTPGGYPLAFENEVLKLVAQTLTPEQKAQVLKNLEGMVLPLENGVLNTTIVTKQGYFVKKEANTGALVLWGGNDENSGILTLYGKEHSAKPGSFTLKASDGSSIGVLDGSPNGTLKWVGNDIATFAGVLGGTETRLDTTIRFSNGLMVYYSGFTTGSSGTRVGNYPIPFTKHQPISGACIALSSDGAVANNVPKIVLATSNDYTRYKVSAKRTDTAEAANVYVYFWAFGRWK